MNKYLAMLLLVTGLALAPVATPAPGTAATAEISYLLEFVGKSGCAFQRNGTWHSSIQAQAHLGDKYDYLRKHGKIKSAEDFIELAATRSSLTGRSYEVRCAGATPQPSSLWLAAALARHRGLRSP